MDDITERFFQWRRNSPVSDEEIAEAFGHSNPRTFLNWQTSGIPKGKQGTALGLMATESLEDSISHIRVPFTDEQLERTHRAASLVASDFQEFCQNAITAQVMKTLNEPSIALLERETEGTIIRLDYRFVGSMAAGEPVESQTEGETLAADSDLDPASHVIYEVNGQSAEPQFMDGERWLVDISKKGKTAKKGVPAVFRDSQGCYLKIYQGGKTPFRSVNPDFADVEPSDSLELVGYPVERV